MGNAGFAHEKSAAHIYVVHQFPPLPFSLISGCEGDSTGVVDEDINLAKGIGSGSNQFIYAFFKPDVSLNGKYFARTFFGYYFSGGIYGSVKLWIDFNGFTCNGDIRSFPG